MRPWSKTTLGMLATSAAVIVGMLAVPLALITIGGGQHWPGRHAEPVASPPLVARGPQRSHRRHEHARRAALTVAATPATGPVVLPPRRRLVSRRTPRPALPSPPRARRPQPSPIAHIPPRRHPPAAPPAPAAVPVVVTPVAQPAPPAPAPAPPPPPPPPGRPVAVSAPAVKKPGHPATPATGALPPGLAKKPGGLPPGLAKKLDRRGDDATPARGHNPRMGS